MCEKLARSFLFVFNFMFVLTGIALIGMGAYIQIEMAKYLDFIENTYVNTGVVLIIVGVIIFGIAFLGCCGAIRKSACMLLTFATLLAIIFIAEVAVIIVCYVFKDEVQGFADKNMKETMNTYGKPDHEGATNIWDSLQADYKCCGITGKSDWEKKDNYTTGQTPDSCCVGGTTIGCGLRPEQRKYDEGCLVKFVSDLKGNVPIVAGVGVGIAVIQVIGVITACVIGKKVKDGMDYV